MEKITDFKSLFNLMAYFNTEEKSIDFLITRRWGEKTPECTKCKTNRKVYYIKSRKTFKCSRCNKQQPVKQGTIYQNSNVPLAKWYMAEFLFINTKKGISSIQLGKDIGVQQKTAWLMLHKLRHASSLYFEDIILKGIVEVDETFLGSKVPRDKRLAVKKNKTKKKRIDMDAEGVLEKRRREKKKGKESISKLEEIFDKLPPALQNLLWDRENRIMLYQPLHHKKNVVGLKERNIKDKNGKIIQRGRLVLTTMGRQSGDICKENIIPFLQDNISKKAHIMTDKAKVYIGLEEYFAKHSTINHSSRCYVDDDITTNSIENGWCMLKKVEKGTFHHFSWKYSMLYLYEFAIRHNLIDVSLSDCFMNIFDYSLNVTISKKEITSAPDAYFYKPR